MALPTPRQREIMGRVMPEFEHGELKSGRGGKGGKVTNRSQAIAIALHEAGASKYESETENRKSLARTERKEAHGETYQQEAEGKSHVGAKGRRESSPAMGGSNARHRTAKGTRAARARAWDDGPTYDQLYDRAKKEGIEGRSKCRNSSLKTRSTTEAAMKVSQLMTRDVEVASPGETLEPRRSWPPWMPEPFLSK